MQGNKEVLITAVCRHTLKTMFAFTLLKTRVLYDVIILSKCNVFWYSNIKLLKTIRFFSVFFLRT